MGERGHVRGAGGGLRVRQTMRRGFRRLGYSFADPVQDIPAESILRSGYFAAAGHGRDLTCRCLPFLSREAFRLRYLAEDAPADIRVPAVDLDMDLPYPICVCRVVLPGFCRTDVEQRKGIPGRSGIQRPFRTRPSGLRSVRCILRMRFRAESADGQSGKGEDAAPVVVGDSLSGILEPVSYR